MKKRILLAVLSAAVLALVIFVLLARPAKTRDSLQAGESFEDFIVAVKNASPLTLKDFTGKGSLILAFTDNSAQSKKFLERLESGILSLKEDGRAFMCFLVTRAGAHAVIEEKTSSPPLMYRMPYSRIPAIYSTLSFPLIIHIGKDGHIKLVYSGYSPTMFSDISDSLKDNK
ncbi:MAG TPA: hypothetical protein ENN43_08155 [bacterium]|nr:hypothetical protein [bacterium]